MRVIFEVVVGHKLHDIGSHVLAQARRVQRLLVAIKLLHGAEVCIADTDNNDSEGQLRAANDLIDSLAHVVDHTIRDDDQNVELLRRLALQIRLHVIVHLGKDFREVSRAIEATLVESILVALDHTLHSVHARVEDITVQGEAVRGTVRVGRDRATEAVQVDLLVRIIELQDVAHVLDRLKVLVALGVEVMQGGWLARVTIRQSEIDGDREVDLAATENILEEGVLALNLEAGKLQVTSLLLHLVSSRAGLELSERHSVDRVQDFVFA